MLVSAEVRWFWRETVPPGMDAWFRGGAVPPGGGTPRTDEYLIDPSQVELGLKTRGAQAGVEIKGLIALAGATPAPFAGQAQIWGKWRSQALSLTHVRRCTVRKRRWLRKFDTAGQEIIEVPLDSDERPRHGPGRLEQGCHLELVDLLLDHPEAEWWSLGFEAFGELDTVESSLMRTLSYVGPNAPALHAAAELSYPAWLAALHR